MNGKNPPESVGVPPQIDPAQPSKSPIGEFSRKVCRYFLEFLESDFKRAQAPRRRIQLKNDAGFRTAIPLRKYPLLADAVWKLTQKKVEDGLTLAIPPRKFTATISPILLNLIEQHVSQISADSFERIRTLLIKLVETKLSHAAENPEKYAEGIQAGFAELVSRELVAPLLGLLEGVFRQQAYAAVESIFEIETDLVDVIAEPVISNLPDALNTYLVKRDLQPAKGVLADFFEDKAVRERLTQFFSEFATADAYQELRDIRQYASTGDNLQLYIYFVDLRFSIHTYPVFYMPARVEFNEQTAVFHLTVDPHVYVNKRAIDFVQQERKKAAVISGISPISDRIIYLEPEQKAIDVMNEKMGTLVPAFDLPAILNLDGTHLRRVDTAQVRLTTSAYLAVFDRSDEATLNDYEELLAAVAADSVAVQGLFERIVKGFILDEPKSILSKIEGQWDSTSISDRLVAEAPIPVNEEQRKIMAALNEPNCRFIAVSGPPGCGKSHTITAIAFDCIMKKRSTLILSDKVEALNVVQEKLEDALSSVRHGAEFPNPILRLGKQGGTYQRLIASAAQQRIREQMRAHKSHEGQLNEELLSRESTLKNNIATTISSLSSIKLPALREFHRLEKDIDQSFPTLVPLLRKGGDARGASVIDSSAARLGADGFSIVMKVASHSGLPSGSFRDLQQSARILAATKFCANDVRGSYSGVFDLFPNLGPHQANEIAGYLARYEALRMPLFGFLFRKTAVTALNSEVGESLDTPHYLTLHKRLHHFKMTPLLLGRILQEAEDHKVDVKRSGAIYRILARNTEIPEHAAWLVAYLDALEEFLGPKAIDDPVLAVGTHSISTPEVLISTLAKFAQFRKCAIDIEGAMQRVPDFDYVGEKAKLEQLHVSRMANELDKRFLGFVDNNAAIAKTLGGVIKKKAKFPTDAFGSLKEAFPCIIAGIREFAEYVPLKEEIFDVVIIDEASQVSVAQAFPALLRSKKVIVFGDEKQFSNVKSMNASNALNAGYLTDLDAYFKHHISDAADRIERLKMFDVKKSVLSFMGLVSSYNTMLTKHFRGYQELISFSSEKFYEGRLQAIKVRGRPIDEVIAFNIIPLESVEKGKHRNTNKAEAEYIRERLHRMIDEGEQVTVAVITPFREQVQLITKILDDDEYSERFRTELRLKVFTFDTCQGEERETIFYSLVATEDDDKLNYMFPVDITVRTDKIDEMLKMQRLNVGFSRAQETIEFVMSKPIESYKGSMRKVLQHYERILKLRLLPEASDTDPNSPMERKVLGWLQRTPFYQKHADHLEVVAQFKIGDYLRQLDPYYKHPSFRVDFLVRFYSAAKVVQIIIEYDGLKEHFDTERDVHAFNYENYYRPEDLERQLIIEGYGYSFLRVNRFNLGTDPIATLSERLERLVGDAATKSGNGNGSNLIAEIRESAQDLHNGDAKVCADCQQVKPIEAFFDPALAKGVGGHGRICKECKLARTTRKSPTPPRPKRRRYSSTWRRRRW